METTAVLYNAGFGAKKLLKDVIAEQDDQFRLNIA